MESTDNELLTRWTQRNDASAFKELADRHASMVFAVCRRILNNPAEAEDVAQECFEALLHKGDRPGMYLGAWLHRVAVNLAVKRLRGQTRQREREKRYVAEQHGGEVSWDDISAHIDTAVSLLPDKLRLPVVLHFFENRTQESIAQELGLSRPTVTYRIAKAVDGIRNTLRRRGVIVGVPLLAGLLDGHLAAGAAPQTLTQTLAKLALARATVVPKAGLPGWFTFGGLGLKQAVVLGGLLLVFATVAVWKILPATVQPDTPVAAATAKVPLRTPPVEQPLEQPKAKAARAPVVAPSSEPASPEKSMVTPAIAGRAYMQESGEPITGLTVVLHPQDDPRGKDVTTVTGTEGRFRFEGLPQGAYKLNYVPQAGLPRPPSDDMQEKVIVIRVKADQAIEDADLAIRRGVRVTGRVVDELGQPVQGASVEGRDRNDNRSLETFITGPDGAFALAGFRQTASFTLEAQFNHTERTLVSRMYGPVALGPQDLSEVLLTLGPGACLRGRVVDPDDNPVAGATLCARPKSEVQVLQGTSQTRTGADGAFTLKNITPGLNGLDAIVPGDGKIIKARPPWNALEVSSGQEIANVTIVLDIAPATDTLEIAGRVVDAARNPVADVEVMVQGASSNGNAWTAAEGTFLVKGLKPGPCRLNVKARRPGLYGGAVLEDIAAGTEGMEIVLPATGAVAGRVMDSTGAPVRDFDIRWQDDRNRYEVGSDRNFVHQRAEDGSFELKGVEPGACTVTAKAAGHGPVSVDVPLVASGQTVRGVTVRLEQEAILAGVVTDKEGVPVANAGVIPGEAPQSESTENAIVARTGSDGTFRLTGLPHDMALVTVYHPDYAIVSMPVKLRAGQESTVNVTLTQGGSIEGTVYLDDQPWPGRELRLNAGRAENMFGVTAITSVSGTYRFGKVRIGQARLILFAPVSMEVSSRDHRVQCKVVDVLGDKTTKADFHFSSCTARMEGTITLNGAPVSAADAGLALEVSLPDGIEQYNARLDADGTYRFPCIVDGAALLKVWTRLADPAPAPVEVSIVPGETLHQDIELGARLAE